MKKVRMWPACKWAMLIGGLGLLAMAVCNLANGRWSSAQSPSLMAALVLGGLWWMIRMEYDYDDQRIICRGQIRNREVRMDRIDRREIRSQTYRPTTRTKAGVRWEQYVVYYAGERKLMILCSYPGAAELIAAIEKNARNSGRRP